MKNLQRKQIIKIPNNISVFYCNKKKIIILKNSFKQRSLKLKTKIIVSQVKHQIEIPTISFSKLSNNKKKKAKAIQGTIVALLNQLLIETKVMLYKKLHLVGVGYRGFPVENFEDQLISFKLGYSHTIYYKIPSKLNIFCLKLTKLFIYGFSYQDITLASSQIRAKKLPEPYKGKGIRYENEKIVLKEGKKI